MNAATPKKGPGGRPPKVQALLTQFAERLQTAADNNPNIPPKYQGQYSYITEQMEKKGAKCTLESVRKWFAGENKPSPDKMLVLADIMSVDHSYLTGGDSQLSAAKLRKVHSAQSSASANILAGVIAMDGGHPAFPRADDERAQKDRVDLYAVIQGVNYGFQIAVGEVQSKKLVFRVSATRGMVLVIGVVRREDNRFEFYELSADILETGDNYERGMLEISAKDGSKSLKRIESFTERL